LVSLSFYLLKIIMADLDQRDAAPDWSGSLRIPREINGLFHASGNYFQTRLS